MTTCTFLPCCHGLFHCLSASVILSASEPKYSNGSSTTDANVTISSGAENRQAGWLLVSKVEVARRIVGRRGRASPVGLSAFYVPSHVHKFQAKCIGVNGDGARRWRILRVPVRMHRRYGNSQSVCINRGNWVVKTALLLEVQAVWGAAARGLLVPFTHSHAQPSLIPLYYNLYDRGRGRGRTRSVVGKQAKG